MLLGEFLIQKKLIAKRDLDLALNEQKRTHDFLGMILVRNKSIKEEEFLKALSELFHIPFISLKHEYIDWDLAMSFSASVVLDRKCLPFRENDFGISVAILNPLDVTAISQIEAQARDKKVNLILVTSYDMQDALKTYQKRVADKINKMFER
ncbi:MAG: hypothetical protein AUJ72_05105 [Candidatus Omnitrophica bacterium CG1_02_46_14]|nr:MAG: hypothetical protein AUJ72_05105 [Candidatus Omnitrophica bacterium CG1_02_46_14]